MNTGVKKKTNILAQAPLYDTWPLDITTLHILKSFKVSNRYIFFANENSIYSNKENCKIDEDKDNNNDKSKTSHDLHLCWMVAQLIKISLSSI